MQIDTADHQLLAAIAETMAEAVRRGGEWVACRPGCTQCCFGPFAITQLDARRLRQGLAELAASDPDRAAAVRSRAAEYVRVVEPVYPGDPETGELHDEDALPDSLDELACPALDPATGTCDLYSARPIACRTFGPATFIDEQSLGACELCYVGATEEQMLDCAVQTDPDGLEQSLLARLSAEGVSGMTVVAYALTARGVTRG